MKRYSLRLTKWGLKSLVPLTCLFSSLHATPDLRPWYGEALLLEPRFTYELQSFEEIDLKCGHYPYHARNHFFTLGSSLAYEPYALDFELTAADTKHHSFYFDDAALTLRYQWLNDVVGDFLSVTSGITVLGCSGTGLRDVANFFHGHVQTEFHTSLGKECAPFATWKTRWWLLGGVGIADMGSPYLRFNAAQEIAHTESGWIQLFVNTLWGLGSHDLCLCKSFHGYGSIRHKSVDLGAAAFYNFESGGTFALSYARRLFSRNCPKEVNIVKAEFIYPIGWL